MRLQTAMPSAPSASSAAYGSRNGRRITPSAAPSAAPSARPSAYLSMRAPTAATKRASCSGRRLSAKRRIRNASGSSDMGVLLLVGMVGLEQNAQPLGAAPDVGLHRAERQGGRGADLAVAQALVVGQHDTQPLVAREPRERAIEVELLGGARN